VNENDGLGGASPSPLTHRQLTPSICSFICTDRTQMEIQMALQITASGVAEIGPGVWAFEMAPHQVRLFGTTNHSLGTQSVLLLAESNFDSEANELRFDFDGATPVNVGTTSRVIALAVEPPRMQALASAPTVAPGQQDLARGDREFLDLSQRELSTGVAKAAEALLRGVRAKSAGALKRGQSRNFSETPDNFWYVIIQPRVDELSITVRGSTDHFSPVAKLEIKDDRGNTRFKVRGEKDVPHALDLIFHALRKR
jgi:hypothetical protein